MPAIVGRDPHTGEPLEIVVQNGLIHAVRAASHDDDVWLSPGLIDLQVNGFFGYDVNRESSDPETIIALTREMIATGVTTFLPTVITASEEKIVGALRAIAEARQSSQIVADAAPFIHIEGPNICADDGPRGAHPREHVRPPDLAEFDRWQQAAGGLVGMVTLSPHFEGVESYIAELRRRGVHVAIGHTNASAEQIHRAIDAGANLSTHLGNGIAAEIPRHRNPIWPQLADDRLFAAFIADGHHLPPYVLKAMLRANGVDRSLLVSDSVALAGMPAGEYLTPVGGRVELRTDGRLCVFGSELLAGATASLAQGVGNLVRITGLLLHEALAMATVNPGKFVPGRGQLNPGSRADVLRFRWQDEILIEDVWLAGEQVFTRSEESRNVGRQQV